MRIIRAQMEHFGKFTDRTLLFSPGLNLVYGANESGKSTLHRFLTGMLFGMEKQRGKASGRDPYLKYEPWEGPAYYAGALEFTVGGQDFLLERNFYHKEKRAGLKNLGDGEELSVEHGDLKVLLGGIGKSAYENTCCISQAAVTTEKEFAESLKNDLVSLSCGGENGVDIGSAVRTLQKKRKTALQEQKELIRVREERLERLKWEGERLQGEIAGMERQLQELKFQEAGEESLTSGEWSPTKKDSGEANDTKAKEREGFAYGRGKTAAFLLCGAAVGVWHVFRSLIFQWNGAGWAGAEILLLITWLVLGFRWLARAWAAKNGASKPEESRGNVRDEVVSQAAEKSSRLREILWEQLSEKYIRMENLEQELLEASGKSLAEQEIEEELEALSLAVETMERVSRELYEDSRDALHAEISQIFSQVTGGKYDRVELNGRMELELYCGGKKLLPWQLSRGTMEQLYFSLRMGAGRMLTREEPLPLLLDEPFCAYDDIRLGRTLEWLSRQKEQVILLSCQRRELSLLEQMGAAFHSILL